MTKTVLFILAFIPACLFGQQTKKIIDKENYEVFYVLKSDKSIKHGNYQKFNYNGLTIVNGYFKNGIKDSIWEFYDNQGELQQKFNFTKNEFIYYKSDDKTKGQIFSVIRENDTIKTVLDRPPLYIGSETLMNENLFWNIRYPREARENGITGTVYISFTIAKNGKTNNHKVARGIGYGCDEEALRVVKEIPDSWFPGLLNGQTVNVEILMPISFRIKQN